MWVLTAAGDVVNVATARRIALESDFDSPEVRIVAYFGRDNHECVTLTRTSRLPADSAKAAFKALTTALRDGDAFCDLSATL